MTLIGIISDTHRLIPDRALRIFEGDYDPARVLESYGDGDMPRRPVDYIIHAGDIGDDDASVRKVLGALSAIAPTFAVAGNCDANPVYASGEPIRPELQVFDLDGSKIACVHDPKDMKSADADLFVHGHTHRYGIQPLESGLRLCPGAIHDPRNDMGYRTVALVSIEAGDVRRIEIVRL